MSGVASTQGVGTGQRPVKVRAAAPVEPLTLDEAARVREGLVTDALDRLGVPSAPAPPASWRTKPLSLGQTVRVDGQSWTLIEAHDNELQLATRAVDGNVARRTLPWADVVATNPHSLGTTVLTHDNMWMRVIDASEVATQGRAATVDLIRDHAASYVPDAHEPHFKASWGDIVDSTLRAVTKVTGARPTDARNVRALRSLIGDRAFAEYASKPVDWVPSAPARDGILVGTDSTPGVASASLEELDAVRSWFVRTTGLEPWGPGRPLIARLEDEAWMGNAAAQVVDGASVVRFGPAPSAHRDQLVAALRSPMSDADRAMMQVVDTHRPATIAHEVGHLAFNMVLPENFDLPAAAQPEYFRANEAIADLFAAAYVGSPDIGVRQLDVVDDAFETFGDIIRVQLETLKALDAHIGTQLLNRPIATTVALTHGWEAVAQLAGDTVRTLGAEISTGTRATLELPAVAATFHAAAAARYGAADAAVVALGDAFRAVQLLR